MLRFHVRRLLVLGVLPALGAVLVGCDPASTPGTSPPAAVVHDGDVVTLEASALRFHPARLVVDVNATITVRLVATDTAHTLMFMAPGQAPFLQATPASPASARATFSAPGTYQFHCTIPGHTEAGMVGELVVSD